MRRLLPLLAVPLLVVPSRAADPCVSGLDVGQRPGPYSSVVSVGPQRGQSHCFICETADKPAVVVFARRADDDLARLVRLLDQTVADNKTAELRAWVTFLNEDQTAFDPILVAWAKKHAVRNVPLSVFEDRDGPPAYRLHRDADVTVLLFVERKVVANFAFRKGELTEARLEEVRRALPLLKK
jgi:hypothetical protein